MAEKVIFLPGCDGATYYSCDDHRNLIPGKEYEVIQARDLGFQTNYTLKGVGGEYNSVWFAKATEEKPVYVGAAMEQPTLMKSCECLRVGDANVETAKTSTVIGIQYLNSDVFKVTTLNSIYFLYVNLEREERNSESLAKATDEKPIYVGVSKKQPIAGEYLECCIIENYKMERVRTSKVVSVEYLSNRVFKVATLNSVYLLSMQVKVNN